MMEISKKTIFISILIILMFSGILYAESIWEGSAAMGRYGEFPFTGYYGASNSFQQNAFVEVENLENGKRTRLIVVDRLSDSGLLMLVSNEAAQELGIFQNDIARIKVRKIFSGETTKPPQYDDLAYNPDPDLNPAAALGRPDDLLYEETEPFEEPVIAELPPVTDGLNDAEALVADEPVPADIAADSPEKPFEPEAEVVVEAVPEVEAEADAEVVAEAVPEVEAEVEAEVIAAPVRTLELISSGLGESSPLYMDDGTFRVSTLPDLEEKVSDEEIEYLTESSDYYAPVIKEAAVVSAELPVPEPEIPEEVIIALVGDHLNFAESTPYKVEMDSKYMESPELIRTEDMNDILLTDNLREANPMTADGAPMLASALPALPSGDESSLIEVANGYISPESPEFTTSIADYPNPNPDIAPEDETILVEAADLEMNVPEYDENIEVSLVPAEVRPPELIEEENSLVENEAEEVETIETDIAVHSPELEEDIVVETETVVEAAVEPKLEPEVEVKPEVDVVTAVRIPEAPVSAPEQVQMVSKLMQQKHYLQLGAFKEKNSAIKAAGSLVEVYPVTIFTDEATANLSYKLLLGPLSADESGIMLYNFRAGGYSDAFIRRIE